MGELDAVGINTGDGIGKLSISRTDAATFPEPLPAAEPVSVRVLYDRLLVRRIPEEKVIGGIVIPDTAGEKPLRAEVVAVGEGRLRPDGSLLPLRVKVGDVVLFGKYAGNEIKIGEEEHLVLKEDEVLCVLG